MRCRPRFEIYLHDMAGLQVSCVEHWAHHRLVPRILNRSLPGQGDSCFPVADRRFRLARKPFKAAITPTFSTTHRRIPVITNKSLSKHIAAAAVFTLSVAPALADHRSPCRGLPSHSDLKAALSSAVLSSNGGFGLNMWGTVVNRDGVVCAVVFTGDDRGAQWPGSRVISAEKANTANSFSLDGLALSTAQLYPLVQPGASLYGLQHSNPVDTKVAYKGPSFKYGSHRDPMVGKKIGGVNVFGGGLALYVNGKIVGALGVSGDTSCEDHNVAWQTRKNLALNVTPTSDNISFEPGNHPACPNSGPPPSP